jgi:hypothetical protein
MHNMHIFMHIKVIIVHKSHDYAYLPISIMDNTIHCMGMYILYRSCLYIDVKCIYSCDTYFDCPANFIHCMNCIVDTYHVSRMCVLFLRELKGHVI